MNNAKPKPSQAKPSQAKPSQAASNSKDLVSNSKFFLGKFRKIADRLIPESSFLYKRIYFSWKAFEFSRRNARQAKLRLVYTVTDACNLNCAMCSTFSPLVKKPRMVELAQVEKDMARLSELFDSEVESLDLMGGELLLHPNVVEIITTARRHLTKGVVRLLTNGLLLHEMPAEFWESCHKNHICVMITPYPINLNYERIIRLAEEYGVELIHFEPVVWAREKNTFRKQTLDASGRCSVDKSYRRCPLSVCQLMWNDGRIYRCSMPAFVGAFNDYFDAKFEVSEKDYIDVCKVKDKEEIFDFFTKPIPFCRYCDLDNWQFGLPWGRSKKEIGEWM